MRYPMGHRIAPLPPGAQAVAMDLSYPQDAEEFRAEIRSWLEANLPAGWADGTHGMTPEEKKQFNQDWTSILHEGGGSVPPGRRSTAARGSPRCRVWCWPRSSHGPGRQCGPTSSATPSWGRPSSRTAPRNRSWSSSRGSWRGTTRWCQGSASPNSGSDLASLSTTAVLDGDQWVIHGQKVWTTQAQFADYCFLLARTDPDAKKHAGISYLLVPMQQEGIEVRGIVQPDGTDEFNEVFFDGARCPEGNVVGGIEQRLESGQRHPRFRTRHVGHHRSSSLRRGVPPDGGGCHRQRRHRGPPRTPTAGHLSHQDSDPAHQRAPQPQRGAVGQTVGGYCALVPPTRCSGRRCTKTPCSWPSTSSGPMR